MNWKSKSWLWWFTFIGLVGSLFTTIVLSLIGDAHATSNALGCALGFMVGGILVESSDNQKKAAHWKHRYENACQEWARDKGLMCSLDRLAEEKRVAAAWAMKSLHLVIHYQGNEIYCSDLGTVRRQILDGEGVEVTPECAVLKPVDIGKVTGGYEIEMRCDDLEALNG